MKPRKIAAPPAWGAADGKTDAGRLYQGALFYADLGFAVIPCAPADKRPLTTNGLLDATSDPEQISRWWFANPDANVAIRTDGLVVVDIDGPDNTWLSNRPDRRADLARAPTAATPRGGRHHFFRQPHDGCWRNTAGRIAPRVDTRADGGYVLVAPSVVGGKRYEWSEGHELNTPPRKLLVPPAWLIELLRAPAAYCRREQLGGVIPEGRRNATLARLAGAMRRVGMTEVEILDALCRVNADRCIPPLSTEEVERIARSISRYQATADPTRRGPAVVARPARRLSARVAARLKGGVS